MRRVVVAVVKERGDCNVLPSHQLGLNGIEVWAMSAQFHVDMSCVWQGLRNVSFQYRV